MCILVFSLDILLVHWVCRVSFWLPHLSPVLGKILTPFHVLSKLLSLFLQYRWTFTFHILKRDIGRYVGNRRLRVMRMHCLAELGATMQLAAELTTGGQPLTSLSHLHTYLPTYSPTKYLQKIQTKTLKLNRYL